MKLFVILGLIAVASAHFQYQQEWEDWTSQFQKTYSSDEVALSRQIIWESNKVFVDNHNMNADKFGFTVEMNEFADLDPAEFSNIYNGLLPRSASYNATKVFVHNGQAVPSTVDWREKGVVTEVKNQGQCGSCWSFSTTGSLEGQHALKTGNLVSMSEQQLVDCSTKFGNHGCQGGLMDFAFEYLETVKGDDSESSYRYTAENGVCHYEESNAVAKDTGYTDIPHKDEDALMKAVGTVGPISVAMDAGHKSFQLYKDGIYYEPVCSETKLDHGVLAVGYGSNGGDYWLIKNSWGDAWGMKGYFMIARNRNNNCGIATQASYPTGVN